MHYARFGVVFKKERRAEEDNTPARAPRRHGIPEIPIGPSRFADIPVVTTSFLTPTCRLRPVPNMSFFKEAATSIACITPRRVDQYKWLVVEDETLFCLQEFKGKMVGHKENGHFQPARVR